VFFGHALRVQTAPSQSQSLPAQAGQLQAKIAKVARTLQSNPRLKNMSLQQRENMIQFIMGNMLLVLLHELGDAAVLGREDDAADNFAVVR
jgi:hypothetical protein